MTGISASGKSTVAQALAERLPRSAHVRGDTYRRMIGHRPLHVVVLAPSVAAVERRERERAKTGYGDFTVADLDAILREQTPRIGLWLDSSEQIPGQTADEILQRLPEALV